MPSWNLCPLSDEAYCEAVPHDASMSMAANIGAELIFIVYLR